MKFTPRLLKEARLSQNAILFSICLGLLGGIMGILQAREVSRVINQVFLEHQTLGSISYLLVTIVVLIMLRIGFTWAGEVGASAAARRIKQDLRHRLFTHIINLGPAYLRNEAGEAQTRTGELVITATEGIDALEVYFSQYLPQIALSALLPLSILFFVFPVDILSGVIFLVTAPLLPVFMYLIGSAAEALTRRQWQGLSRMGAYFLDVFQGLTTLKSLGRSREQLEVIKKVSEHYRQSTMNVLKVTFLSALVLELIATLSTAVVAVEIGLRLLYGKLAFEQAFFLLLLAPEFYQPLRLLGTRFHAGMAGVEAARRIFEILDIPILRNLQADGSGMQPQEKAPGPPSIALKDVGYTYADGHTALQGISFDIPPGKVTALVGESGAGKTSLTWLLLRFLQPQSGQILVDHRSISDVPYTGWLDNLAWVPQNPYLFNDTILANIRLAKPEADDDSIYEAARLAHADEFIKLLPMGYQTQIGERGKRLSTGQAQRIALARAFLKEASFLILDEATSHLDPETDSLIRASMKRLAIGRTVLVIAHHQNTLAMAHQVVTLHHGKLAYISAGPLTSTTASHAQDEPLPVANPLPHPDTPPTSDEAQSRLITPTLPGSVDRRLLKLLSPYLGRIALSVLLGFATIASGIGLMATAAYIICAAALHPSIAELQVAIVGVRFFGLSRGIFRYLDRLVSHDTTLRLLARWRTWFYQALEPLAPGRLMGYHSGDLLTRVISDIGSLENFYVRSISPPLVALLVGISTTLFLAGFGVQLAWGLLFFLLLAGVGLPLMTLVLSRRLGPKIIQARARLNTMLVDGIQGMADILTCGQATAYTERVRLAGDHLSRLQTRMSVVNALQTALGSLLANLGMLTVLVLAIQRVSQGQLDGILLGVATLTALTCFEALQPLPLAAQNYDANHAAASRLYELVDVSPLVIDPPEPLPMPGDPSLEVQNLSFEYPQWINGQPVTSLSSFSLKDISFSLPKGRHIALIGPSGAGKTTIVNILLRFWEYHQGSIRLGGHELRQYRPEDVRKHMAIISQSTHLFNATIKENLLVARPQATEDDIIRACTQAQLHDFIVSLPEGYDTWIGEHGLHLSAGERQRLAVARALIKDAPLLILDEPTANLDPSTELALLNSIRILSHERSSITITQSMVGLESMDEILVVNNGSIVERGTHDHLLSRHGQYYRMWELYHHLI